MHVGDYDRARELVIDPSMAYSTFLGGGNEDDGFGIAVDSTGAAYVTGQTPLARLSEDDLVLRSKLRKTRLSQNLSLMEPHHWSIRPFIAGTWQKQWECDNG